MTHPRLAAPDTRPRVLALDLSITATGVARQDGALDTLRPLTKGDQRLHELTCMVALLVALDAPVDLVAIEGPVVRSSAAVVIGMVHGAVRRELIVRGVPYLVVPPASVKTYATGKGNATKPDMRMALFQRAGLDVRDDNQVDAWWLRALTLDLLGHPVLDLPKTHRRALDKLEVPAGWEASCVG